MRYYYKLKSGKGTLNLKSPVSDDIANNYTEITEKEYNALVSPPEPVQTEEQKTLSAISKLKRELAETDYKCLKYVDGALTEEEYAPIKAQRAELRRQINELETKL